MKAHVPVREGELPVSAEQWQWQGKHCSATTLTENRSSSLSSFGARRRETTVREGLGLQSFPKLSGYTNFAPAFCVKSWVKAIPIKRKQNRDGFEKTMFSLCLLAHVLLMSSIPSCPAKQSLGTQTSPARVTAGIRTP